MAASAEYAPLPPAQRRPPLTTAWRWISRRLLTVYAGLALLYLFIPIFVVIAFSFNKPKGRFNFTFQKFTFSNWLHPFAVPGIKSAITLSIEIAVLSAVISTILGSLMALGLMRHRVRGQGTMNMLVFLPMATPEIVMGSSLLTLFLNWQFVTLGFATILIAHIMFNISYVVVTVRARLAGFDRHLEEAAMDLGANGWTTFWKVTLPLIAPGVFSAAMLAFALSIDDFVVTYFNSGSSVTFPLFVWGSARVATPPQINVIGTAIFLIAVLGMLVNIGFQSGRAKRKYA
jgi:spermidine/putrescine transport system permease protein